MKNSSMSSTSESEAFSFFRASIVADRLLKGVSEDDKHIRIKVSYNSKTHLYSIAFGKLDNREADLTIDVASYVICFIKEKTDNTINLSASFPSRNFSEWYAIKVKDFQKHYNRQGFEKHDS